MKLETETIEGCSCEIVAETDGKRWPVCLGISRSRKSSTRSVAALACHLILLLQVYQHTIGWPACGVQATGSHVMSVKIGALLEESDHEQANMLIRTIKMINEAKEDAIRQLLNISTTSTISLRQDRPRWQQKLNDQQSDSFSAPAYNKSDSRNAHSAYSGRSDSDRPARLEPMIEFLADRQSAFEADAKVCQLIESGVHAMLGPTDGSSVQHVQSICDNMEIPYFELRPFLGSGAAPSALTSPRSQPSGSADHPESRSAASQEPSEPAPKLEPAQARATSNKLEDLTLNLYPPASLLTSAYIDLIYAWNWSSFAIVYDSDKSMVKLQDLFRESSGSWTSKWRIRLFQLTSEDKPMINRRVNQGASAGSVPLNHSNESTTRLLANADNGNHQHERAHVENDHEPLGHSSKRSDATFRDIFWRIKLSGEHNILLDVGTNHLYEALKQAQQVGCMTERYNYLITSLDLHTIELEDFMYSRTRITAFNIIQLAPSEPNSSTNPFDENYLERLGVHHIEQADNRENKLRHQSRFNPDNGYDNYKYQASLSAAKHKLPKYKLSPSIVLDRIGAFMDPPERVFKDFKEPQAHLGSLMSASSERTHEQRLFEFLVNQQERNLSRVRLSTSSAILHDSMLLYSLGLSELDPSGSFVGSPHSVGCWLNSLPWSHGSSLVNYMRRISFRGLTGKVSFDPLGLRTDFRLDLMGVAPEIGLVKVGEWHSGLARGPAAGHATHNASRDEHQTRADQFKSHEELAKHYELELKRLTKLLDGGVKVEVPYTRALSRDGALKVNELIFQHLYVDHVDQVDTLIVSTKLSQPYFMLKETPNMLTGNEQYEGFAVDLIHELAKLVNFKYRWKEVADRKYGSKEVLPNGTIWWNGMIGDLVRGQADLAIVDLTITAQREEAVDFTLPFMNTGISILFKKPTAKVTTLFSFLSPFSSDVWAYVLAAYCSISGILFFVGHLSPYEWADPNPCRHSNEDEQLLKNQFSLLNAFWFTIGSLMQQGSDLTPRSMSTRTIAGIWYFFTLIMISSYTANLAAFLTVEKVVYPIENVRDLSNQEEIKYGCVESGSTCTFFHDSQIDTYKKINETMRKFKTYVRSNDEGQKRVEEGKFAFFMESASIEYIVERNCNLTQIGGLLDSKGYGLATSKKSRLRRPYRTLLSEGILHLQETGMLHVLKNRWWKERRGGGTCTDDGKGGGVTELSLANVGGVFVVLLGGLGISFLVAIAEFMWRARRSGKSRDKICEDMMSDLKFALACKRSTKPVAPKERSKPAQQVDDEQRSRSHLAHMIPQLIAGQVAYHRNQADPPLINALLTMIARQQNQRSMDAPEPSLTVASEYRREQLANNGLYQDCSLESRPFANQSVQSLDIGRLGKNMRCNNNYPQEDQQQYRWIQPRLLEAERRRLLFAHHTIDADDSFTPQLESLPD